MAALPYQEKGRCFDIVPFLVSDAQLKIFGEAHTIFGNFFMREIIILTYYQRMV